VIRIAVAELESWFLGDVPALEAAFPKLARLRLRDKARYQQPDQRPHPAVDLERELKHAGYKDGYSKLAHSAKISQYLSLEDDHNRSHSFQVTLARLRDLLT
jgi:hypothetical protein